MPPPASALGTRRAIIPVAANARDNIAANDLCELMLIQFELWQNSERFLVFLLYQSTSNDTGRQTQEIPKIHPNRQSRIVNSVKPR